MLPLCTTPMCSTATAAPLLLSRISTLHRDLRIRAPAAAPMSDGPVHRITGPHTLALVGWVALCFSAAGTGILVSTGGWYAALQKPSWSPPAWIFGPVWTVLYAMMAAAALTVWREGGWAERWRTLALFVLQLLLNALWTPLFFGWHRPGLAFLEILLLWLVLAATVHSFWLVKKKAALLLVPYFLWVTFAAALNFSIWQLNP